MKRTAIPVASIDPCEWERCSPFQQAVLRATCEIPRGRVDTYGGVAMRIGKPGASRAVGHALATNPFPITIPCHRIVRSDRTLGGYGGGRGRGRARKRELLASEGVRFESDGRVSADCIQGA
jgi:methylated-DNA-[protein]-cysteine S-methyltransferase